MKTTNVKLPRKIEPCPIVDALLNLRFKSSINKNAVFGVIYKELIKDFPNVEDLPILQLPENIRTSDSSLKYKPYYRVSNRDFVIQIGPNVITVGSYPKYKGWTEFSKVIFDILKKLDETGVVKKVERVGLRYINFFDVDIFNNIDLEVNIRDESIPYENTIIKTEIKKEEFINSLQIANNVKINKKSGSVIDIDTYTENNLDDFFENKKKIINSAHTIEKTMFFDLLKQEFLNTFETHH